MEKKDYKFEVGEDVVINENIITTLLLCSGLKGTIVARHINTEVKKKSYLIDLGETRNNCGVDGSNIKGLNYKHKTMNCVYLAEDWLKEINEGEKKYA